MSRISVICAVAPGPNPGMASVDLSAWSLLRRHVPDGAAVFYQLYTADELLADRPEAERAEAAARQKLPFEYRCARGRMDEIYSSDAIIYWGDFLHMAPYQQIVGRRLAQAGVTRDREEAAKLASEFFFLSEAPDEVLGKAVLFGGTLLFNSLRGAAQPDYERNFARLFRNAHSVRVRDVYSALYVNYVRQDYQRSYLGPDCALLLAPEELAALPRGAWTADPDAGTGCGGLFFGRSQQRVETLVQFARDLCQALECAPHWLPWGAKPAFSMQYDVSSPDHVKARPAPEQWPLLGDLFELIRRYRVVITDTYHLCVNAWSVGVPAICIAETRSRQSYDVNCGSRFAWRDKRQVLYGMYDALDFFVYGNELGDAEGRAARIRHLAAMLQDPRHVQAIVERMRRQADAVRGPLAAEIAVLCGLRDDLAVVTANSILKQSGLKP